MRPFSPAQVDPGDSTERVDDHEDGDEQGEQVKCFRDNVPSSVDVRNNPLTDGRFQRIEILPFSQIHRKTY